LIKIKNEDDGVEMGEERKEGCSMGKQRYNYSD
jgi:hypothetical protein